MLGRFRTAHMGWMLAGLPLAGILFYLHVSFGLALIAYLLIWAVPLSLFYQRLAASERGNGWTPTDGELTDIRADTIARANEEGLAGIAVAYGGRVTLSVSGVPSGFSIAPRKGGLVVGEERLEDGVFDLRFQTTRALVARAFLDADARRQLIEAQMKWPSLAVREGKLIISLTRKVEPDEANEILEDLLIAGRAMRAAATRALSSESPAVRLRAAIFLDDRETILAIADDTRIAETIRADALRAAGPIPEDVIGQLVSDPAATLAVAAVKEVAQRGLAKFIPRIVEEMPKRGGPYRLAAAFALSRTNGPEAPLIEMLDSAEKQERSAAIAALARVGTIAAVPKLSERVTAEPSLATVASAAIAAIQARAVGAEPGQLALSASVDEGALSVSDEERARLSLARVKATS